MSLDEEDKYVYKETFKDRIYRYMRNILIVGGILLIIGLFLYLIYWFFHDCIGIEMNGFGEVLLFFFVVFLVIIFRVFK